MAKRSSLFGSAALTPTKSAPATAAAAEPSTSPTPTAEGGRRYPVAKTREGKRVATVYLEKEALKALQRIALDEDTTLQALLVEGINAVFQARGLSRIG